jgi:hypothetical protein
VLRCVGCSRAGEGNRAARRVERATDSRLLARPLVPVRIVKGEGSPHAGAKEMSPMVERALTALLAAFLATSSALADSAPPWPLPDRCVHLGQTASWRNCVVGCTGYPMSHIVYPGTAQWATAHNCGANCQHKAIMECWRAAGGHGPTSPKQAKGSTQPVSANAGTGGTAFCDPSGKCTPAPSAAPPKSPAQSKSSCSGLSTGPGGNAIGEESCSGGNPSSSNAIPKTNGSTACFAYNAAHTLVPVDCSTPGALTLAPAAPPPPTRTSPPSPQDVIEQNIINQNAALQASQSENPAAPSQQAALSARDANNVPDLRLPLNTDQLAAKIAQCVTETCTCSSFPISRVPVVGDVGAWRICGEKYKVDPDFSNCVGNFTAYDKQANAYNQISKKTCPQNYSDK